MKTTKEIFNIIKKYPNRNLIILRWYAEIAIRNWRDEHCPFTPDWTTEYQGKFYGHFHHQTKIWMTTWTRHIQEPGTVYFETAENLRACIDALPDEWNALLMD